MTNRSELVDVVDSRNLVVGSSTRDDAHANGLLHRVVVALLTDHDNRWLLVRQAGDRQDAHALVMPVGGHVRAGESELEALAREVEEEVGMSLLDPKLVGRAVFDRTVLGRRENHLYCFYEMRTDQQPRLNAESIAYRWLDRDRMVSMARRRPATFGGGFYFVVRNFYPDLHRAIHIKT
jgi:8-oxo-dGTP pyrophosphatase MutT (NUDIX family)